MASRRAWVDPEDLIRVLREDGYRELASAAEAEAGDVVAYLDRNGEVCHAALVVRKNVIVPGAQEEPLTVLSKWGADGEYAHELSQLPDYLGTPGLALLDGSEGSMNRLDDLFKNIESYEFSAVVNLASDFKTFVRILAAQRAGPGSPPSWEMRPCGRP